MNMLNIRFKQKRAHWCGPATLLIIQKLLARSSHTMTQEEWAVLVKTDKNDGTTVAHMKRGLSLISWGTIILRNRKDLLKQSGYTLAGPMVVYDHSRDHWLAAEATTNGGVVYVHDPETGMSHKYSAGAFYDMYLVDQKMSYILLVRGG